MKIFIVIKIGAYMQGIFGVFDTKIKAEKALKEAELQEMDDYHDFKIFEYSLNTPGYLEWRDL